MLIFGTGSYESELAVLKKNKSVTLVLRLDEIQHTKLGRKILVW